MLMRLGVSSNQRHGGLNPALHRVSRSAGVFVVTLKPSRHVGVLRGVAEPPFTAAKPHCTEYYPLAAVVDAGRFQMSYMFCRSSAFCAPRVLRVCFQKHNFLSRYCLLNKLNRKVTRSTGVVRAYSLRTPLSHVDVFGGVFQPAYTQDLTIG